MSLDSIDYAEPDRLNGCNLYAYCNNNPVMFIDPYGNDFMDFLEGVGKVALSIVIVVGISVGIAASGGALAIALGATSTVAMNVAGCALLGGFIFGGASFLNQWAVNGAQNINIGSLIVDTVSGSIQCALTGASIGAIWPVRLLMSGLKIVNTTLSTYLYQKSIGTPDGLVIEKTKSSFNSAVAIQGATFILGFAGGTSDPVVTMELISLVIVSKNFITGKYKKN